MKLVDILALELNVWPGNVELMQKDMGGIWEVMPSGALGIKVAALELSEDWGRSSVTQAQWQAAVDALKVAESAIPAPSDEAIEAWLVGLEIPYGLEAAQACREIINNHKRRRDEAVEIQKIRDEIKWQKPQIGPCPVEQMYLLGYRKFEIVDN